jgi:hypothetical protein
MTQVPQIDDKLFDALSDFMDGAYIGKWLKAANPAFENGPVFRKAEPGLVGAERLGTTPLQVIERGEADRIWQMIYCLQTGEPV